MIGKNLKISIVYSVCEHYFIRLLFFVHSITSTVLTSVRVVFDYLLLFIFVMEATGFLCGRAGVTWSFSGSTQICWTIYTLSTSWPRNLHNYQRSKLSRA